MPTPEEMTIPDKLDSLNVTKQAIREAIVAKGVEVPEGTTFYEYAGLIDGIETGGGISKETVPVELRAQAYSGLVEFYYLEYVNDQLVGGKFYSNGELKSKTVNLPLGSIVYVTSFNYLVEGDKESAITYEFSGTGVHAAVVTKGLTVISGIY